MVEPGGGAVGNVLEYAQVARRRGWVIVLTIVLAGTGAYFLAKRAAPVYQAQAEVLLRGSTSANAPQSATAAVDVDTELRVLRGFAVQQEVRKVLPNAVPIAGAASSSTNSFTVTTHSVSPKLAADSANAYANAYIKQRRTDAVNDALAVSDQIQAKLTDLQHQIDGLGPPTTAAAGKPAVTTFSDVQRTAIENQLANYKVQYNDLQLQLSNLTAGAVILRPAGVSATPIAPRPLSTGIEGAAGGLVLGLGLAFLLEYVDDTLRTSDVLERLGGGLPVLGVIPTMASWRDRTKPHVIVRTAPNSPAAEAFRYLRTGVRFLGMDRALSVIHVTSPSSRDGKTTTVANLATALAQAGEQVVIVDLDLRRPRIHEFFGMPNDVGFTSLVAGTAPLSEALRPVAGVDGLTVLTSGPPPSNPSELLSSTRAAEILNLLRAKGSLLVVDSLPLLPVADASIVSTMADVTLLVTSAGLTKKSELKRSLDLLAQVKAPLAGTVLNRAPAKHRYYYTYRAGNYPPNAEAPSGPETTVAPSIPDAADDLVPSTTPSSPTARPAKSNLPPKRRLRNQ